MALNRTNAIISKPNATFLGKAKQYFHKISFAAIITNDNGTTSIIDLSNTIFNFKIFHVYNAFVFPVVAVGVNLTTKQHIAIADNLENVQFRLNIDKLETTDITDTSKMVTSTTENVYKNLILELSDYEKKRFRDESEQYNGGFEDAIKIQVYMELFKAEHLKINKNPLNGIFNDVDMDSLMVHLLTKSNQRMLIQKSNRKEKIKQIVLPSKNLAQTIYYLQKTYGIYKSGIRLFFDFDRGYCLTHDIIENEPVAEKEPFEYKNVVCYVGKSATESSGCWFDEKTKTYYMLMPNTDQFSFSDKSAKDIYGNKLVFQSITHDKKTVNLNELENNYKVENENVTNTVLETRTVTTNQSYTVQSGDTLIDIGRRFNLSVSEIVANNSNISNPDLIYVGQILQLPITTTETVETTITLSEAMSSVVPDEKNKKIKYYYNNSSNTYAEDELLSLINRNELKYVGVFKDIDISFLSMNKTIYLSFLDESYTDYNGMYEIEAMGTVYNKIGINIYETDTIVNFTRLTKNYLSFS